MISSLQSDSAGPDNGSNASLNAEWVQLANFATSTVTATGWTITGAGSHRYTVPAVTLAGLASVKVHTGHGSDSANDRY